MPNYVLTEDSGVSCSHEGQVDCEGTDKLRVNGNKVLLREGIISLDTPNIDGCPIEDNTSTATYQCLRLSAVLQGAATRLKVSGMGVMLDTLLATATGTPGLGTPTGEVTADADQEILSAI